MPSSVRIATPVKGVAVVAAALAAIAVLVLVLVLAPQAALAAAKKQNVDSFAAWDSLEHLKAGASKKVKVTQGTISQPINFVPTPMYHYNSASDVNLKTTGMVQPVDQLTAASKIRKAHHPSPRNQSVHTVFNARVGQLHEVDATIHVTHDEETGGRRRRLNIFGVDNRVDINEMAFPNYRAGALIYYGTNYLTLCTAQFVGGAYTILTAAHCVLDTADWFENTYFYPAFLLLNSTTFQSFGAYRIEFFYEWTFQENKASEYEPINNPDWAVAAVTPLTASYPKSYFGWKVMPNFKNVAGSLIDYSGDHFGYAKKQTKGCRTYGVSGEYDVLHSCDTAPGSSGAVIYNAKQQAVMMNKAQIDCTDVCTFPTFELTIANLGTGMQSIAPTLKTFSAYFPPGSEGVCSSYLQVLTFSPMQLYTWYLKETAAADACYAYGFLDGYDTGVVEKNGAHVITCFEKPSANVTQFVPAVGSGTPSAGELHTAAVQAGYCTAFMDGYEMYKNTTLVYEIVTVPLSDNCAIMEIPDAQLKGKNVNAAAHKLAPSKGYDSGRWTGISNGKKSKTIAFFGKHLLC